MSLEKNGKYDGIYAKPSTDHFYFPGFGRVEIMLNMHFV